MNTLENIISAQNIPIPLFEYLTNLLLTILLSFILSYLFIRYGKTLSNRQMFGKNFVLLSTATMIVITIVKSSLALSLGLVGALSIVRFRTAVKEPEELIYLFLCITIGLGLGANQRSVTLVGFAIVVIILIITNIYKQKREINSINLIIRSKNKDDNELDNIISLLRKHCIDVDLKRFDGDKDFFEVAFLVNIIDYTKITNLKKDIDSLKNIDHIAFFDTHGVV